MDKMAKAERNMEDVINTYTGTPVINRMVEENKVLVRRSVSSPLKTHLPLNSTTLVFLLCLVYYPSGFATPILLPG